MSAGLVKPVTRKQLREWKAPTFVLGAQVSAPGSVSPPLATAIDIALPQNFAIYGAEYKLTWITDDDYMDGYLFDKDGLGENEPNTVLGQFASKRRFQADKLTTFIAPSIQNVTVPGLYLRLVVTNTQATSITGFVNLIGFVIPTQ